MNIINVELYSIVIILVLLANYIVKFRKNLNVASIIWGLLACSTMLISISNILFTLVNVYEIKLISTIIYLLSTLMSSLCVYIYIKYMYINEQIIIKNELKYTLLSIFGCTIISIIYIFFTNSGYVLHSFERSFFNKFLILAIIPNIMIGCIYIIHTFKNKNAFDYKIMVMLSITILGLIFDILNDSLFFVSATFTITTLIMYINKHDRLLNTDPLTGLANKRGLEALISSLKNDVLLAVYNVDIDKFKRINDKYGHLKGDEVLKITATILRNSSRNKDLVIRNGGDEFLIVAEIQNKKDLRRIEGRIKSNLKHYNAISDIKISLSIGSGIYRNTEDKTSKDFTEFLKKIDIDMYKQKSKKSKIKKEE